MLISLNQRRLNLMVSIYTDKSKLKENEIFYSKGEAVGTFYREVLVKLDFEKYKDIFYDIEQGMCIHPEDLIIDFEHQRITNSYGTCHFAALSSGMKHI
jgi:hypothetical protein